MTNTIQSSAAEKRCYTVEELQKGAPETDQGYWCVPQVIE